MTGYPWSVGDALLATDLNAAIANAGSLSEGDINVRNFGAVGDGVADDTAALNAAMDYVRAHPIGGGSPGISTQAYCARFVIPPGRYLITSPLNWTLLFSLTLYIEAAGAIIVGRTSGKPMIDALGSRWLHIHGLTLLGDTVNSPNIGLQIGRYNTASADLHHLNNVTISGVFTFCSLYNFAAEGTTYTHLNLWNQNPSAANTFTLVLDGINHWNAHSDFVTVAAPGGGLYSHNDNLFLNASIMSNGGGGPAVWIAGTSNTRFVTSYIAQTAAGVGMVLWSSDTLPITQLSVDAHFETVNMTDIFLFDGPGPATQAYVRGLLFQDHAPQAINSLFKVNTANVAHVTMIDMDVRIDYMVQPACKVFDNPSLWSASGRYAECSGSHWIAPSQWEGITDQFGLEAVTARGGLHCGSQTVSSANDVSKHLDLFGGIYGMCVSAGSLNLNTGANIAMYSSGAPVAQMSAGLAIFPAVATGGSGGPTWTTGSAVPSSTQPVGSLYSRVSTWAAGATLYVSKGGGAWTAVASV